MKNLLYDDLKQWRVCMKAGLREFSWGLWTITKGIVFGFLSVLRWVGRLIEAFCRRESIAAAIIATLIVVLVFGWTTTYLTTKTRLTTAEYERDSIAYTLDKYMQAYDSVVIDGDTVKYNN